MDDTVEEPANLCRTLGYQDHAPVDLYFPAAQADPTKPLPV